MAKVVSVRIFIALATCKGWPIHQLDINNAFLHGYLKEEVYLDAPEGYTKALPGQVCRLKLSLYGLKQASREWNSEFTTQILKFGLTQSSNDSCLFTKDCPRGFIALTIYVDDMLLTGACEHEISQVKAYLDSVFSIKDLGLAKYFLGVEIARSSQGTYLCQRKYILDIIDDTHLSVTTSVATPLPKGHKFALDSPPLQDAEQYRRLIGRLLYLNLTRPDITFSVQQLSQFVSDPRETHLHAALHVVRYLKGTSSLGIFYSSTSNFNIEAYCDSDWASCPQTRRSLSGYCILLGSNAIS